MQIIKKYINNFTVLLFASILLQSCVSGHVLSSLNLKKDDQSLISSSYIIADVLSQYIDARLGKNVNIQAESFYLTGNKDIEVPIGVVVSDYISNRLVQLGYDISNRPKAKIEIIEPEIVEESNNNDNSFKKLFDIKDKEDKILEIPHITPVSGGFSLSGVLTETRNSVLVSVKIINKNNNNKIIAVYEYDLDKTIEVRDLLKVPGKEKPGLLDVFY